MDERIEQSERMEPVDRYTPRRMGPSYAMSRSTQACPCGSGLPNSECHFVREVDYLAPAPADADRPLVSARGHPLSSDPRAFSSGVATRCHACGAVLTVGLSFGDEEVVLVCDCGARNAVLTRSRPSLTPQATDL